MNHNISYFITLFQWILLIIFENFILYILAELAIAATDLAEVLGMAIGIGGGSIISRALGKGNAEKARETFGNQLTLTLLLCLSFVLGGLYFSDSLIPLFGGQGRLFSLAKTYYVIVLYTLKVVDKPKWAGFNLYYCNNYYFCIA